MGVTYYGSVTPPASSDAVSVRPMRRSDIPRLAEATRDELSAAQLENRWREQEAGYRELFVAELEGKAVGNVSLHVDSLRPPSTHLFALEVATDMRGRGIGSRLVRFVLDEARRRGSVRVFLEVRADNPARRLYHRLGFRRVGPEFTNGWWRYKDDGSQEHVEERSVRMVRRLPRQGRHRIAA
jgi:ribosomal protein S18 acetylase RimI-like enzyme